MRKQRWAGGRGDRAGPSLAFRYVCDDDAWFNDEAADAYEVNGFGVDNSILDLTGVG